MNKSRTEPIQKLPNLKTIKQDGPLISEDVISPRSTPKNKG